MPMPSICMLVAMPLAVPTVRSSTRSWIEGQSAAAQTEYATPRRSISGSGSKPWPWHVFRDAPSSAYPRSDAGQCCVAMSRKVGIVQSVPKIARYGRRPKWSTARPKNGEMKIDIMYGRDARKFAELTSNIFWPESSKPTFARIPVRSLQNTHTLKFRRSAR